MVVDSLNTMTGFLQFSFYQGNWEDKQIITLKMAEPGRRDVIITIMKTGPCAPDDGQPERLQMPISCLANYVDHLFTSIYYDQELTHVQIDGTFMPAAIYTLDEIMNPQRPSHLRRMLMGLVDIFQNVHVIGGGDKTV